MQASFNMPLNAYSPRQSYQAGASGEEFEFGLNLYTTAITLLVISSNQHDSYNLYEYKIGSGFIFFNSFYK